MSMLMVKLRYNTCKAGRQNSSSQAELGLSLESPPPPSFFPGVSPCVFPPSYLPVVRSLPARSDSNSPAAEFSFLSWII